MEIKLIRRNRLAKEIVFADGIGSSGKGMLSQILASFERIEKQRNDMMFDTIPRFHALGKISDDAAIVAMQTEADQQLYHMMMSRDVNFRLGDSTSVLSNPFPLKYFKRIFSPEGDMVVEKIKKENPILNEAPHDALKNANLFFNTFGDQLKIIYILRNPIEVIHDWERRGFGNRIGVDPREFQFSYEYDGSVVPLYALGWEEEYHRMNSIDRNIKMIEYHYYKNIDSYNNLDKHKNNVLFILFSELVGDPYLVCDKLVKFLNTKTTFWTKKILNKNNCPRIVNDNDLDKKYHEIIKNASNDKIKILDDMIKHYEEFSIKLKLKK
jgi:hypothetical protein